MRARRRTRSRFWLALGGAGLLYLWATRTPSGQQATETFVSTVLDMSTPRGIRNNNPGNIERTAERWRGMSADQGADERFVVFSAPVWGLRAMARILRNDLRAGRNTVRALINEWAPPAENDTSAYVAAVAAALGVDADAPVTDYDLHGLMQAIVRHENGIQPYAGAMFDEAIALERAA